MAQSDSTRRDVTIRQSIWIAATPERVYRALTTRDDLVRWFASEVESEEIATGAPVRFVFASCRSTVDGRWLELEPNRRIAFLFDDSRVSIELEPLAGGTRVTLTDAGLPRDVDHVAGQSEGWAAYLCNLKVVLELGRDLRADQPAGTILPK